MDTIDNMEMNAQSAVSGTTKENMQKAARWMRLCAIIGFLFVGLMVIFALAVPELMETFSGLPGSPDMNTASGVFTVVYVIIALLFFLPNLYFYQSAASFSRSVNTSMDDDIETGFKKLHSLYLFIGVIFIIYFAFILIALLGALATGI